jgi:cysteine desulfurase
VNIAGAVGAAAAMKFVSRERNVQAARLRVLREKLIDGVLANVSDVRVTGHPSERLPHHASFVFKDVDGESLLMSLDVEGIAVSTGSACTSGDPEPSPVLVAMGIPREWSLGGLRISLGYHTSEQDIDRVIESLPMCVERVRKAVLDF